LFATQEEQAAQSDCADENLSQEQGDPWNVLRVIRRLEIGSPCVEPNRVTAAYRIVNSEGVDETEFVYRYQRRVFDDCSPATLNLASLMVAQIAVNYGLFCEEIVFRGVYDKIDRQFLTDMMENTAREIAVNKILKPNPFLRGPASRLPAVRRDRYSRAVVRFVDEPVTPGAEESPRPPSPWGKDGRSVAILSSGGKESLLSLGLLREIGASTFPLFVNESGRHWLTALNAFRYLSSHHPGTDRVWTNSDRLFSWFLRHLSFIRQDFSDVRCDEYPIRLWTVAIFLFGVLPLLRKNNIGQLVIGDEFDTTRRTEYRGIPNYDGLYDQSRFFDRALTRFFRRKGWQVEQFSVLRPLSELLIQKTLKDRYPGLFEQQVSCHAAHIEGERVHPCGRCEKCRRIVAMLVALNDDPTRCGYTRNQVTQCLRDVSASGVHQEKAGAQHLGYLLSQQGLLPSRAPGMPQPQERPEVEHLRFDRVRSPWDAIPVDFRKPLYRILLQHAKGVLHRTHGEWDECGFAWLSSHYSRQPTSR
jgi:hypothetical protein